MDQDKAPALRRPGALRVETTRSVVLRDFFIFQVKLALDGMKDIVLSAMSVGALVLDLLAGAGKRPRMFYKVLAASEKFDLWLNLSGAVSRLEEGHDLGDDGLFGASEAGSDSLLGKLEEMVRGGEISPELKQKMDEELKKRKEDLKRWADGQGFTGPGGTGGGPGGAGGSGDGTGPGSRDPGTGDSSGGGESSTRNPWDTGR